MSKATAPDVEQLMSDYFAARNGDESKMNVLSETFTFIHPFGEVHGVDEMVAMQHENKNAMPDLSFEIDSMLVGDNVAMWEWTLTGTQEGEWQGIPPTGEEVTIKGMSKTLIADGKVQENRAYFNPQDIFDQLGVTDN